MSLKNVLVTVLISVALGCVALRSRAAEPYGLGNRLPGANRVAEQFDLGSRLYDAKCAVCHGMTGRGDGPYANVLTVAIPDLTSLDKRNKGVFPFQRVYEIIDGRLEIAAHGRRDMPIWGSDIGNPPESDLGHARFDPEFYIRMRILALTEYLSRLQTQ
jgi:mono/diheme cytochrome c family protein